ncbi:hypothetical protein ABH309_04220 [Chromobacterium piscinae]|uniref:Uncharacterized protein n=1 Tax=Chromobacterium piscinae TaxID=686831 RepID=A0ABV0H2Y6_9NEIS
MEKKSRIKKERRAEKLTTHSKLPQRDLLKIIAQADNIFKRLTTPKTLTEPIINFCKAISDLPPFFLECEPEPWSRLGCCDSNVIEYIRLNKKGESTFGYRIWVSGNDYIEAESHAIWKHEMVYRDVSFSPDGEKRILFLPVSSNFSGSFDSVPKKIRHAFSKEHAQTLQDYEKYERQYVNYIEMPRDEAWNKMQTYEQWQASQHMKPIL